MPETIIRPYEEKMVSSALLEIPRNTYQRGLNPERVKRISHSFDERIANEPKVSLRDGHYFVFDGQHIIAPEWITTAVLSSRSEAGMPSDRAEGLGHDYVGYKIVFLYEDGRTTGALDAEGRGSGRALQADL